MLVSRATTLLMGVATLATSIAVNDVVGALTVAYDLLTGALFVPIVGARSRREDMKAECIGRLGVGETGRRMFRDIRVISKGYHPEKRRKELR